MSITAIIIITFALASIVGGIFLLKKSASKFNITPEQMAKIKKRNEALAKEEQSSD